MRTSHGDGSCPLRLRSDGPVENEENVSGATIPFGVTILPNLITSKFVHKKFIQKYEWIDHAISTIMQSLRLNKICARRNKKEEFAYE